MNKLLALGAVVILALVGGFFLLNAYVYEAKQPYAASAYTDAEFMIEGEYVRLSDGVSETSSISGSSSNVVTRYFGNELRTDVDGDGSEDVVFLLTQERGGPEVRFYVVAALNTPRGYLGSDGYLLGDRIAPQNTTASPNPRHVRVVVANYADRALGEDVSVSPSMGKSAYLKIDPTTRQWGVVVPDFEGESR
jgi:hypothetical protein